MERRLAAILGYSRLVEADEAGTLGALKAHRAEFIDPEIASHGGRIVKLMGDGALVEFPSVVDAVECAVVVQQGMATRNGDVPGTSASISASESIWAISSSKVTISMAMA